MAKGVESIIRVRTPKVDKLKPGPVAAPAETSFGSCEVLPRQPVETENGQVGVEGWDVWCFDPAIFDAPTKTAKVLRTDQVRVRGELHNVVGVRPFTKRGRFKAVNLILERVT